MTKLATRRNELATRRSAIDSTFQELINGFTRDYPNNLRFISDLWDHQPFSGQSYPPYNIEYGENTGDYRIEVALAGFSKDDLEVEFLKDQKLTIRSKFGETEGGEKEDAEVTKNRYVKRGIGKRGFKLAFSIPQYSVVKSCEMRDGLLVISIRREIPEEERTKLLDIR